MKLTAANVNEIFTSCLFQEGEDTSNYIPAEGIMVNVGFHPGRLEEKKDAIKELISQLPSDFMVGAGGGMSFLNACMTAEGEQWGEHRDMEQLFLLGIASGMAKTCLPREMWAILPGGMPYYMVDPEGIKDEPVPQGNET